MRANGLSPGALVDLAQDRVGRGAAVGQHDLRGRRVADAVVFGERFGADAALGEPLGEAARVEDRLAGAVRAARNIGCAASPSSVTRPKLQRGSGSWSTIG